MITQLPCLPGIHETSIFKYNNNSDKVFVCIGDSWTQGQGVGHDHNDSKMSRLNYPYYLSQLSSDYDVINLGKGGYSNTSALNALVMANYILKPYKECIILFGLTKINRFPLWHHEHNNAMMEYNPNIKYDDSDSALRTIQRRYYTELQSEIIDVYRLLVDLVLFQKFCKSNNYKSMVFNTFDDFNLNKYQNNVTISNLMLELDFNGIYALGNLRKGIYAYLANLEVQFNKSYISECGHPNTKGYKLMAEHLLSILKQKGI